MFAGNFHPANYSNSRLRNSAWSRDAGAEHENNGSAGKSYEHYWCEHSGYGPREFSNSNCTASVAIHGVCKANKFWAGCTKYLRMKFRILLE